MSRIGRPPNVGTKLDVGPAQLTALDDLIDTARDLNVVTACRADAEWWSQEPPRLATHRASWKAERAIHCHQCPVLAQCRALVDAGMRVDGVTAGERYEDGRLIKDGARRFPPGGAIAPAVRAADGIRHGTRAGYEKDGCRDDCCRLAKNAHQREYRAHRRAEQAS